MRWLATFAAFILAAFLAMPLIAAEISATKGEEPEIIVEGQIAPGDSKKIKSLLTELSSGGRSGEVVFDSPGGSFMEGIYIGMEIFEHGWGTRIRANGICMSSCAVAFLGGRFNIPGSGWIPDRNLEAGATLGFHSFYVDRELRGSVGESMDLGRSMANIMFAYGNMLRLRPGTILKILNIEPDGMMFACYPFVLQDFGVSVSGLGHDVSNALTPASAVNASINLLEFQQPMLLNEGENNWRLHPKAGYISPEQFEREMLQRFLMPIGGGKPGQVAQIIANAMARPASLRLVYDDFAQLGLVPAIRGNETLVKTTGLDHVNPYMNKVIYFISRAEGSPENSIEYLICPQTDSGRCEEGALRRHGEVIYELQPKDRPLWLIK